MRSPPQEISPDPAQTIEAQRAGLVPALHYKAGYKTAVVPPSQNFRNSLATREASI
jgi:hypothetical protein